MTPAQRKAVRVAAQLVVVGLVGWFVARALRGQWDEFRQVSASIAPDWTRLAASGGIVLATYALLVDVWRRLVGGGGVTVPWVRAARVWFVSGLGKYVPGKLWSIAAMGAMAQREGVSAAIATVAAILNQAVNVAAGFAVVAASGARVLRYLFPGGGTHLAIVAAVVAALGILALPAVLPPTIAAIERRTGRPGSVRISAATLWYSIGANAAAWVLYGTAFHLFANGLGAGFAGRWVESVAVFTASYLLGYLALFVPGGLVVREGAMVAALIGLGAATPAQATLIAVASRLWLTVLEIVPGALFLARDAVPRFTRTPTRS